MKKLESTVEFKPPPRIVTFYSRLSIGIAIVKSFANSWIRIVIRIATKI